MNLRQEAIEALCVHHVPTCGSHAEDLDALLDWFDANAERIDPHAYRPSIGVMVNKLREDDDAS